jgi:hypothetical protein
MDRPGALPDLSAKKNISCRKADSTFAGEVAGERLRLFARYGATKWSNALTDAFIISVLKTGVFC